MAIQKKELWNRKGKEIENDMEYEERTSVETNEGQSRKHQNKKGI